LLHFPTFHTNVVAIQTFISLFCILQKHLLPQLWWPFLAKLQKKHFGALYNDVKSLSKRATAVFPAFFDKNPEKFARKFM